MEKYKSFSVPIEKKITKNDKGSNESVATIIDSARLMASLLPNLVDNLAEETHKVKCKDYDFFLEYEHFKENSVKHKCLSCNKDHLNKTDEELKKDSKTHLSFLIMISIYLFCC